MSDLLIVRDHTQPCEHLKAGKRQHFVYHEDDDNGFLGPDGCPGGREIRLRRREAFEPGVDWSVRDKVWVEVTNND